MVPPDTFDDIACDIIEHAKCAFGITAQYRPKAGGSFSIVGIFDNQFEQVDPDTEIIVTSNAPMFDVKTKDLRGGKAEKGDQVKIKEILYKVIDSQEDGLAATKLILHKVGC